MKDAKECGSKDVDDVTMSESEMGIYKLSNGKCVCFLDELLLYLLLKKYKKEKGIQKYET
jgi:hypothetical protein